jgi:hypothetical protein
MGIKIWLDDIRPMPKEGYDLWCKTAQECLQAVKSGNVDYISFDHDLANSLTGYWVATNIEDMAYFGRVNRIGWDVHSDNPAGRRNITQAMESAERFWNKKEQ